MTTRKRSGSGSKRQLKEKVVQIYESIFRGEDLAKCSTSFWEEFFLLRPKVVHFDVEIQKITPEQFGDVKENINLLFVKCVETLGHEHNLRVVYAMQTLCALVHAVYRKTTAEGTYDTIGLLMGFEVAEEKMQELLQQCHNFLIGNRF